LKDFRGKRIKKEGKEFFVTYHPAAGLRFPKIRKILEEDFKKFKNLLT
jgi:DNA polymerase